MRFTLIDPKIRRHWRRYALQVSLATATLSAALVMEQALAGGVEARAVIVAHGFEWDLILFVALAVFIMVAVHRLLRRHLLDLL